MNSVEDRLVQCFSVVFPNLTEPEIRRASSSGVATWNSLATVHLVALTEDEFQIQFSAEDVAALASFDLLLDCIQEKLRENGT
jgi:acyl carrier protein